MIQGCFRLIEGSLTYGNLLILMDIDWLLEKETDYEEGCTRKAIRSRI